MSEHKPVTSNEDGSGEVRKFSRRTFNALTLGGITSVALAGCGGNSEAEYQSVSGDNLADSVSTHEAKDEYDYSMSSAEVEDNLEHLVLPYLYEDRPWADPNQLVGLSIEELKDIASVPINAETRTNKGAAKAVGQVLELIANSGRTLEDIQVARDLGYPVGETDHNGNELGDYSDYVKKAYMKPMVNSLLSIEYEDTVATGIKEDLVDHFLGYVHDYVASLTSEAYRDKATLFVNTGLIESLPAAESDRSLHVSLELRCPSVRSDVDDTVFGGDATIDLDEDTNGTYKAGMPYIKFLRQ